MSKVITSAKVTASITIVDDQGWGGDCTMAQVRKQAIDATTRRIAQVHEVLAKHGISIGAITDITITIRDQA